VKIWQRFAKSGEFGSAIWQNLPNFEDLFFQISQFYDQPQ
jgi:hypothetical protein